ncbi:unnamed protein product [Anisakis simplex]|uniref:Uncharacterized protein n=1 Tax=Anisakis simplex TaxID=6269 RepID=A0A0M3JG27_ANISI|nr:unnamed protein product [Anisakis simplex]
MATHSRQKFEEENSKKESPTSIPDFLKPTPVAAGSRGQMAAHPYDCMTLACLCPFFRVSCVDCTFIPLFLFCKSIVS